jgi:hypothetical protein
MVPFGSSPKISTPVENTVEKRRVHVEMRRNAWFFRQFRLAKLRGARFSGARQEL